MSPEVESVGSEGTAAPVETSAPDTSEVTAGGVPEKDNGEAAAAAAAAAQYTPNYKFRAADKDHEIPEHFRGLMKDAKAEKEIKELFEKAYGLDVVKTRQEQTRQQRDEAVTRVRSFENGVKDLRETYQRGDFDGFFQKMQIPQEKILQWVLSKVEYSKLPPEQQAILDQKKQAENQAFELQRSNQSYQDQMLEQARNTKSQLLEFSLTRPEVKSAADAFESRTGKPGSFREAVRLHGEAMWYRSQGKIDLTPEQAIKEVMELYGISAPSAAAPQQENGTGQGGGPTAPGAQKPKVIPNMQGKSSASPVKGPVRSLDDIRKISKAMNA